MRNYRLLNYSFIIIIIIIIIIIKSIVTSRIYTILSINQKRIITMLLVFILNLLALKS